MTIVQPTDDVMVPGVQVIVLAEKGKVVEKGESINGKGDWWEYAPDEESKVIVEVRDLPGNVVKAKTKA